MLSYIVDGNGSTVSTVSGHYVAYVCFVDFLPSTPPRAYYHEPLMDVFVTSAVGIRLLHCAPLGVPAHLLPAPAEQIYVYTARCPCRCRAPAVLFCAPHSMPRTLLRATAHSHCLPAGFMLIAIDDDDDDDNICLWVCGSCVPDYFVLHFYCVCVYVLFCVCVPYYQHCIAHY